MDAIVAADVTGASVGATSAGNVCVAVITGTVEAVGLRVLVGVTVKVTAGRRVDVGDVALRLLPLKPRKAAHRHKQTMTTDPSPAISKLRLRLDLTGWLGGAMPPLFSPGTLTLARTLCSIRR